MTLYIFINVILNYKDRTNASSDFGTVILRGG